MIIIGRKSRNTDQALIKAGIELIAQGNYDPTVRAICTLANVNQGMFVYYFGFKEEYMKVLFKKFTKIIFPNCRIILKRMPKPLSSCSRSSTVWQNILLKTSIRQTFWLKPYITAKLPPISQTTASSILSSSAHLSNRPSVKAISAAIWTVMKSTRLCRVYWSSR